MSNSPSSKKVTLGPLPQQQDDYSHYEETSIRWDRIALAAAIVIAVAYGIYSLLSTSEAPPAEITKNITAENAITTPTQEPPVNQTDANINNQALQAKPTVIAKEQTPTPVVEPSPVTEPSSEKPMAEAQSGIDKQAEAETLATLDVSDQRLDEPKQEKAQSTPDQKPAPDTTKADQAQAQAIQIHHPGITQAQLTSMLKDKAPVDELGSTIPMNQDGIIKVILFTEMTNLRGTRTQHIWYRNKVKQATVNVPANTNHQRSSSSKFINAQMLGDWQVKVIDENQLLLAEANFQVTPFK